PLAITHSCRRDEIAPERRSLSASGLLCPSRDRGVARRCGAVNAVHCTPPAVRSWWRGRGAEDIQQHDDAGRGGWYYQCANVWGCSSEWPFSFSWLSPHAARGPLSCAATRSAIQ